MRGWGLRGLRAYGGLLVRAWGLAVRAEPVIFHLQTQGVAEVHPMADDAHGTYRQWHDGGALVKVFGLKPKGGLGPGGVKNSPFAV